MKVKKKPETNSQRENFNEYMQFFQNLFNKYPSSQQLLNNISINRLNYHKIQILEENSLFYDKLSKFDDIYIGIRKSQHCGLIVLFDVILGQFHLKIYLLNIQRKADQPDQQTYQKIGTGGFGSVRALNIEEKDFAIKRIYFKTKVDDKQNAKQIEQKGVLDLDFSQDIYLQIRKAIRQYSIYKISSLLQIGPAVKFSNQFDLVCYNDCIQFHMQLCESPRKAHNFLLERQITFNKYEQQLKTCLFKLHLLKFVHRDIKPENILYSNETHKFILTDFGLSQIVQEEFWEKTLTGYSGTQQYSSNQMLDLLSSKSKGYANLYINDIYGLSIILKIWKQMYTHIENIQNNKENYYLSRNSMSFIESYSNDYSYDNRYADDEENGEQWQNNDQNADFEATDLSNISSNRTYTINTNNSIPALSTYNTNSMNTTSLKYSSDINYYLSEIIFYILRNNLNHQSNFLTVQKLRHILNTEIALYPKNEEIKFVVIQEVLQVLYSTNIKNDFNKSDNISNKFTKPKTILKLKTHFKNALRIYGPESVQVQQAYEQLIEQLISKKSQLIDGKSAVLLSNKNILQTTKQKFSASKSTKNSLNSKKLKVSIIVYDYFDAYKRLINDMKKYLRNCKESSLENQFQVPANILQQYILSVINSTQILFIEHIRQLNSYIEKIFKFLSKNKKAENQQDKELQILLVKLISKEQIQTKNYEQKFCKKKLPHSEQVCDSNQKLILREIKNKKEMDLQKIGKDYKLNSRTLINMMQAYMYLSQISTSELSDYFISIVPLFKFLLKNFTILKVDFKGISYDPLSQESPYSESVESKIQQCLLKKLNALYEDQKLKLIGLKNSQKMVYNEQNEKRIQICQSIYIKLFINLIEYYWKLMKDPQKAMAFLRDFEAIYQQDSQTNTSFNKIKNKYLTHYHEYIVNQQLCLYYQTKQFNKCELIIKQYIKKKIIFDTKPDDLQTSNLEILNSACFNTQIISNLNTISFISIIKKYIDTRLKQLHQQTNCEKKCTQLQLTSNSKLILDQIKNVYIKLISLYNIDFSSDKHFIKFFCEMSNNLIHTVDKLGDTLSCVKWINYVKNILLSSKQHKIQVKQKNLGLLTQIHTFSKNYIQIFINHAYKWRFSDMQAYSPEDHMILEQFDQNIKQMINLYITTLIQATFKYEIFIGNVSDDMGSFSYDNIGTVLANFKQNFPQKCQNSQYSQEESNFDENLLYIKKLFLKEMESWQQMMRSNYADLAYDIARTYIKKREVLIALKYLWKNLQTYFQNPSVLYQSQYEVMNDFIRGMIHQGNMYRRAWIFLRKYIFLIKLSHYSIRRQTFNIYLQIIQQLKPESHKLQQKWMKELCKNDFSILMSREFYLLEQFQDSMQNRFRNLLLKKWINKV